MCTNRCMGVSSPGVVSVPGGVYLGGCPPAQGGSAWGGVCQGKWGVHIPSPFWTAYLLEGRHALWTNITLSENFVKIGKKLTPLVVLISSLLSHTKKPVLNWVERGFFYVRLNLVITIFIDIIRPDSGKNIQHV